MFAFEMRYDGHGCQAKLFLFIGRLIDMLTHYFYD
jgi:hypothetical protein